LDALAFLDGCFGSVHIDPGWDVCFTHGDDGLLGLYTWRVAPAGTARRGAILIGSNSGALHIQSSAWTGEPLSADAVRVGVREIDFGKLLLRRPDARGSLFVMFANGRTVELAPQSARTASEPAPDIWDGVAFLDGCFGTWHIDAGWDVCFSRTEDGLVGIDTFHSVNHMSPSEHGALLITDIGGVLHVESSGSELGDHLSADAIRSAPHEIAFGTDGKDMLVLRRPDAQGSLFATLASGHTIELKPRRARASATSS
jgi:hypothetical protein